MDLFSQLADMTRPTTPAAFMPIPAQPEEQPRVFTNIVDVLAEVRKISHPDKMNWKQFNQLYKDISGQTVAIQAMINKMTIAEINKYVYKHSSNDSKKDMVSRLYDSIIGSFNLSGSIQYTPLGCNTGDDIPTTYEAALQKALKNQTEEDFNKYQTEAQAERDQRKKAIENPETLEEFRIFLQYRKPETMTTEQRYLYDELITAGRQHQREINKKHEAVVKAVNVEGLEMEIKTSQHAKKNIPLWVVTLSARIDSDTFNELKAKAHKFDGYYSSYRGHGAIPGFTFESEENAKLFTGITEGNVNTYDIQKKTEEEIQQDRAETLEDKAVRMKEQAEEELNRDRKDNTHKRATQAAHAEREALANIQFADTMQKIATGQKDGTIKYLGRLSTITELETLNNLLSAAKMRYIRANNIRYEEYQLCMEVVDLVEFPYPCLYKQNAQKDIEILATAPGCKMAAARMLKNFKRHTGEYYYVKGRREMEDFETLLCSEHRNIKNFYGNVKHYRTELMDYKRVMRMQIECLPELRTALRELVNIRLNTNISPEMKKAQELKELERKFIGIDIPGFFPTPATLAEEIVTAANIQAGNTILEPSAGLGHLAEAIATQHPDNELKAIECNYSLSQALKLKGFNVEHDDFLQHTGKYDRIVMNPPFENGQDMDHVKHAYSLLNDGGRLVAIMAGNKGNTDRKTVDFVQFVESIGGSMEPNQPGAFLSSFRPTGVNTITVILDK